MKEDFDIAARSYDHDFTDSLIGRLQRKKVWKYLDQALEGKNNLNILELNCGTGEDALYLASKGHQVTATDISEKMLELAKSKVGPYAINYQQLDLNSLEKFEGSGSFDLIFSNFGGLNCLDPEAISKVGRELARLLKNSGKFVVIVMPDQCIWETNYFLLKLDRKNAFRRTREYAVANVSGTKVKTWYYSPSKLNQLFGTFQLEKRAPVGLFVPPSYLEHFFKRHRTLLTLLSKMENLLARFAWQARWSDHCYLQYSLK